MQFICVGALSGGATATHYDLCMHNEAGKGIAHNSLETRYSVMFGVVIHWNH